MPCFGLQFQDRIVSSAEIVCNGYWNFVATRLIILSSCLLARLEAGGMTHGMRTALYAKGAGSILGSLWPLHDELCPVFARRFLTTYQESENRTQPFVLGKSLCAALHDLRGYTEEQYGADMSILYGGYILDGLP